MGDADRTYTFRAPEELAGRIRAAGAVIEEFAGGESVLADRLARELMLALARRNGPLAAARENQSAFIRETIELVVSAAEKVAADAEYERVYAEAGRRRDAGEAAVRKAARDRAGARWRDG